MQVHPDHGERGRDHLAVQRHHERHHGGQGEHPARAVVCAFHDFSLHWFRHRHDRKLSDDFSARAGSVRVGGVVAAMDTVLDRARAGDDQAFGELTDPLVGELRLHCYRILGSLQDAEDVLQETLLAAWRGLGQYEGRASVRTWLYRIATNRCLNVLRDAGRRPRSVPPLTFESPAPTRMSDPHSLGPYPDDRLGWLADS